MSAGESQHFIIPIDLSGYTADRNDITDFYYIAIGFVADGAGILDNVHLDMGEGGPSSVGDVSFVMDGNDIIIVFDGELGGTYAVQRADYLSNSTDWITVSSNLYGPGTISVTNDTTEPNAFYRAIVQ